MHSDENNNSELGDGLVIEPQLVVSWQPLSDEFNAQRLYEHNLVTFSLIESLEERPAHQPEHTPPSPDIQRLEAKLNLLLDMVGQLLEQQQSLPLPKRVHLSEYGLEWRPDSPPPENSKVLLELYLDSEHGRALRLSGHVVSIFKAGEETWARVIFDPLDEVIHDHLEKWIFRFHRRSVALARGH